MSGGWLRTGEHGWGTSWKQGGRHEYGDLGVDFQTSVQEMISTLLRGQAEGPSGVVWAAHSGKTQKSLKYF